MITVAVAAGAGEAGHQNIRAKDANHANHVIQGHVVTVPFLQRFLRILGKSEIGDTGETLLDAVVAACGKEFQSPQNAERIEQAAANFILPAFASSESHEQRLGAEAARLHREHAAVFIVRMGGGVHEAGGGGKALQGQT